MCLSSYFLHILVAYHWSNLWSSCQRDNHPWVYHNDDYSWGTSSVLHLPASPIGTQRGRSGLCTRPSIQHQSSLNSRSAHYPASQPLLRSYLWYSHRAPNNRWSRLVLEAYSNRPAPQILSILLLAHALKVQWSVWRQSASNQSVVDSCFSWVFLFLTASIQSNPCCA